jgi:hypothetical protein
MEEFDIITLVSEYGFPTIMVIGLGYFVYFVYNFIQENILPTIDKMHMQLIKVIDRMRMLDQDLIRLQEKVDVVLKYKENEKLREDGDKNDKKNN